MKKVVLKKVDLVKFNSFIDTLTPLNETGTIYFKIDDKEISTDSHNPSGTIIKSLRASIGELCEESNLDKVGEPIKLCFYEGKKVKKALSFLSGNEINCEITFAEMEGELYAETMTVSSPKVSIKLDAADPTLFEYANVPEDAIAKVKDTSGADCNFRMTANEVLQIQKFFELDNNEEFEFQVNGKVQASSDGDWQQTISDDFEGLEGGGLNTYKISQDLFKLLDQKSYLVYPIMDDTKIIFEAEDKTMEVVITLHEDVEL
tara:strand:+ start:1856 stop:2638 length:783 start_codon:yes stop_codon:yes gene_type:complete